VLSDHRLIEAIEARIEQIPSNVVIQAEAGLRGARYADEIEVAAFYLVSEGLANALKHAHATTAKVAVRRRDGRLIVEVSDDGIGFDTSLAPGSGIRNLGDRVEAVGGKLRIDSRSGAGTRLVAELPAKDRELAQHDGEADALRRPAATIQSPLASTTSVTERRPCTPSLSPRPTERDGLGPEPCPAADGSGRKLLGPPDTRVVARLVPFIGNEVEHLLHWSAWEADPWATAGVIIAGPAGRRCTLPPMAGIHERYERLLETGLVLAGERSLPVALQRIVELAAEVTGARYGALGVLGRDGVITEFLTIGVTDAERSAIGHIPHGRGIIGVLIHDARPLRLHDIAEDPRSVGLPPNHPPMRTFLGVPVMARGRVYGNLYLTEKEGGQDFDADDERALVLLAAQAGVAIENAQLYEETNDRAQRLEAIREITTAILAGTNSGELLGLVVGHARQLVDADLATLALPAGTDLLVVEAADGLLADELRGTTFPASGSVTGEVIRTGKAMVLADAGSDDRTAQPIVAAGLGPAAFIPLAVRGNTLGSLTVANARGGPSLCEADVQLVETFAEQAAVAFEYSRLQGQLHRLAVLEDRERIAKELHDGAIQALFAVGMGLQGSAMLAGSEDLRSRIQNAVEELDRVIRDLRNYIFGLRPGILADRQLDQALQGLVEEFSQRSGVVAIAEIDPATAAELSGRAADVVQMAREALSNVSRHAQAATCRVSLFRDEDGAVLEVDDDGRGFDLATVTGAGQGLRNLRERAEGLGGRAEIHSAVGEGTRVSVTIPATGHR